MDDWTTAATLPVDNAAGLTPLDLAGGIPLGTTPARALPRPSGASFDEAVARACERVLALGQCYSAFSGGSESSMALAVTTHHARKRGYPDPIPVTLRYCTLDDSEAIARQEAVIRHLGLDHWERVEIDDELELLGPVARAALRRVGPFWPANAYTMMPLFERARGHIFDLATGSTDFFAFWRWAPLADVLAGHRRPTRRDAAILAATLMPARVRGALARRRGLPPPMPWLEPEAEQRALALLSGRQAKIPIGFNRAVMTQITHRCFESGWRSFQALGSDAGTTVVQPLYDHDLIANFAAVGGWRGFGSKRHTLERVAGHLLPAEALKARRPPAGLTDAFFGPTTKEFARRWSGRGLEDIPVVPEILRSGWLSDTPDPRTAGLMHLAWLRDDQDEAQIPIDDESALHALA